MGEHNSSIPQFVAPRSARTLSRSSLLLSAAVCTLLTVNSASVRAEEPVVSQNPTNAPAAQPIEPENPSKLEIPVDGDDDNDADDTTATPTPTPEATPVPTPTPGDDSTISPEEQIPTDLEGRTIASVRIVGNRVVPTETVLQQVVATKTGSQLSSAQIEADKRRIDTLGFFASVQQQVTPNIEDLQKVDVAFIVVENRPVTGFEFQGNTRVTSADLQGALESKTGTILNRNTVNRDVEKIQGLYTERGLAALVTESRQTPEGVVVFVLQEARVSRIEFAGLKKTNEALVRSQLRVKSGDPFDQIAIRADLNRIFDMGFFDDITYRIADDPQKPGFLIVTVTVKEKRTGQFSVGVGFDNRSKISGFVSVADTNLRGQGLNARASVELGSQRTFELGFGNPFFRGNSSYDISVYSRLIYREPRSVEKIIGGDPKTFDYQEKRTGGRFNFVKPLNENRDTSLIFGFRAEKARLFQVDKNGVGEPVDLPVSSSGSVVAVSAGYITDKRDLRLDPSRGYRRQFIVEQALGFLGSDSKFTKLNLDLRHYFPIIGPPKNTPKGEIPLPRLVFANRIVIGQSLGDLPPFEQYFVGGSETVRGYEADEQFGDNEAYANFELRYRLNRQFSPVAFFDVGKAYGGRFASSEDQVLYGYGVGLRVRTPLGPVRLDLAKGRNGVQTHFGIGSSF